MRSKHYVCEIRTFETDAHQSFEGPSIALVCEVVPGLNARNWKSSVDTLKKGGWKMGDLQKGCWVVSLRTLMQGYQQRSPSSDHNSNKSCTQATLERNWGVDDTEANDTHVLLSTICENVAASAMPSLIFNPKKRDKKWTGDGRRGDGELSSSFYICVAWWLLISHKSLIPLGGVQWSILSMPSRDLYLGIDPTTSGDRFANYTYVQPAFLVFK